MKKVLVVDDSAVMRKIMTGALARAGISEFGQAADGREAVEAARGDEYGLGRHEGTALVIITVKHRMGRTACARGAPARKAFHARDAVTRNHGAPYSRTSTSIKSSSIFPMQS